MSVTKNNTPKNKVEIFVSDTMAIVLYLEGRRIPQRVKEIFQKADLGEVIIYVPAMVIVEIAYLSEKGRIDTSLEALNALLMGNSGYKLYPQDLAVVKAAFSIYDVPELHDRLIAGTASLIDAKLITNDPKIEASVHVQTVW